MDTRCADPSLQLDVDLMILDFLVDSALQTTLETAKAGGDGAENAQKALGRVDDFLVIFNENHPDHSDNANLEFRLKLLQFATLFCRRHADAPSAAPRADLARLRAESSGRSRAWLDRTVAQLDDVEINDLPSWSNETNQAELIDMLYLFMKLAAKMSMIPSARFMNVAAEFMLQSVLEAALSLRLSDVFPEDFDKLTTHAFAWGCQGDLDPDHPSDSTDLLFWDDENGRELEAWTETRAEYSQELSPPYELSFRQHLQQVRLNYPTQTFDTMVIKCLGDMSASLDPPLLVQLQGDRIAGLSDLETKQLKIRCRLAT